MKYLLWTTVGFIIFMKLLCTFHESKNNETPNSNEKVNDTAIQKDESNWSYSEKKDEMDGSILKFAETNSLNTLNFQFPYQGGSYGTLTIRKMHGKDEIILSISKGQFMSGMFNNLRIKFDEEKPMQIGYSDPAAASSDLIFINNSNKLIQKIRKASNLKIEATFYDEGNRVLEFNVKDLKW